MIISVIVGDVQATGNAHTVYGYCLDAANGTQADGSKVTIYIQTRPNEKIYDTVGVTGESGVDNGWAQNTGNFPTPWQIGETLIIEADNGAGYTAHTSLILTAAGADKAPSITLSLPGTNATKPPTNDSYVPGEKQPAGSSGSSPTPVPPSIPAELSNISGINESKTGAKVEANETSINTSKTANVSIGTEGSGKNNASIGASIGAGSNKSEPSKGPESSIPTKGKEEISETSLWLWGIVLLLIIAAMIVIVMVIRKGESYK